MLPRSHRDITILPPPTWAPPWLRAAHGTCTDSASSARAQPLSAPDTGISSTKGQLITSVTVHFFPGITQVLQVDGQVWLGAGEHSSHTENLLQRERLPRELNPAERGGKPWPCHRKSRQAQLTREPRLNWAALGAAASRAGVENQHIQGFCAHLDTCKKGNITSPKTSISGRGEE